MKRIMFTQTTSLSHYTMLSWEINYNDFPETHQHVLQTCIKVATVLQSLSPSLPVLIMTAAIAKATLVSLLCTIYLAVDANAAAFIQKQLTFEDCGENLDYYYA